MKKHLLFVPVFLFIMNMAYAQGARASDAANPVSQMDDAVRELAGDIHTKLVEINAQKVILGQFSYRNATPPFANYWTNQLIEALANMPGRPYSVLSGGATGANAVISGEFVEVADVIRVYTRLIRPEDRSVQAAFHSNFERTPAIAAMLVIPGGGSGSSSAAQDEYEPDSWENPVSYEPGVDANATLISRTITEGDEDFFLLIPDTDGRLTAETTGNMDTYMHLYNYETREELAENDDGGSSSNARIRHNVEAGTCYLAKVRGYSRSATGSYAFRAYISAAGVPSSGWSNPVPYEIGDDESVPVMNRSFDNDSDEDYFLLIPERDGRLVMETTGDLDTLLYFYDAATREELADDDDGGQDYNARIRLNVKDGNRYIAKVTTYDGDSGSYGFRAWLTGENMLPADEYEPDDEPSQATPLEIATPQQHTFHSTNDVDWVQFRITRPDRYIIRARGVNSNRLDTYMELFDANLNSIAEDDDGGSNLDSRFSLHLESGLYYLKVWCLDDEPNQPYAISVERE